jgi:hypothetical protein
MSFLGVNNNMHPVNFTQNVDHNKILYLEKEFVRMTEKKSDEL